MILISKIAQELDKFLSKENPKLYKIFERINQTIDVFVFVDEDLVDAYKEKYAQRLEELSKLKEFAFLKDAEAKSAIHFKILPEDELDDPFYANIAGAQSGIVASPRFSCNSLLNNKNINVNSQNSVQVITFYSYKGGMGRTTTMMAYAMHLAMHQNKQVVIVDCDLEAPGYLNFFDLSKHEELKNGKVNGLVEFFCDSQLVKNPDLLDIDNYCINVNAFQRDTSVYRDIQNIRIVPAGNLNEVLQNENSGVPNDLPNPKDYLEGLSRVNLSNVSVIKKSFELLFSKLQKKYNPDVILLDSRTGFNDIFGTTALLLSNYVVGFFGISMQTLPGVGYLLNNYYEAHGNFKLMLVHSILPPKGDSKEKEFYEKAEDIVNKLINGVLDKGEKSRPKQKSLHRNSILETIGTEDESSDQKFIRMVKDKVNPDYVDLFKELDEMCGLQVIDTDSRLSQSVDNVEPIEPEVVEPTRKTNKERTKNNDSNSTKSNIAKGVAAGTAAAASLAPGIAGTVLSIAAAAGAGIALAKAWNSPQKEYTDEDIISLKMTILKYLNDDLAAVCYPFYFYELIYEKPEKYNAKYVFFRRTCMDHLLDPLKIIWYGNAGSGKTFLYNNLPKEDLKSQIFGYQELDSYELTPLFIKGIHSKDFDNISSQEKRLSAEQIEFFSSDIYWLACLWLTFYERKEFKDVFSQSTLQHDFYKISRNTLMGIPFNPEDMSRFREEMLNDLSIVDKQQASGPNGEIFVMYDNLDEYLIINDKTNPINKSLITESLVRFWRNLQQKKIFQKIQPKIFLATDLYEPIKNSEESVCLNWYPEEIFAFLTYLIWCRDESRKAYKTYLEHAKLHSNTVNTLKETLTKWENSSQIGNISRGSAKAMGAILFGEFVSFLENGKNVIYCGTPWEYFGDLLSIGNEAECSLLTIATILGRNAIDGAIKSPSNRDSIIDSYIFTSESVMQYAADIWYEMFSSKNRFKGIAPLLPIITKRSSKEHALPFDLSKSLSHKSFMALCKMLTKERRLGDEYSYSSADDVSDILQAAGIIFTHRKGKEYRYAFSPFFVKACGLKNPWTETMPISEWSKKHDCNTDIVINALLQTGLYSSLSEDSEIPLVDYETIFNVIEALSTIKGWDYLQI